jgi:hypothetical protein
MKTIFKMAMCIMFAFVALSSCTTQRRTAISAPMSYNEIHTQAIMANLDVSSSKKVQSTVSVTYFMGIKTNGGRDYAELNDKGKSMFGGRAKKVRALAIAKALETGNYDMILNPQYITNVYKGLFVSKYTVTMTGYGVKIKEFYQGNLPQTVSLP